MIVALSFFSFLAAGICYDYVEVHDGPTIQNRSLGKYCGKLRPFTIYSTSNVVLVRLSSDRSVQKKGFQLTYQAKRKWRQAIKVLRAFLGVVRYGSLLSKIPAPYSDEKTLDLFPNKKKSRRLFCHFVYLASVSQYFSMLFYATVYGVCMLLLMGGNPELDTKGITPNSLQVVERFFYVPVERQFRTLSLCEKRALVSRSH